MVTQSGDPNNKGKPAHKKYCSYCHKNNNGISNCYQKQRDEEYQRCKHQRSRTLCCLKHWLGVCFLFY